MTDSANRTAVLLMTYGGPEKAEDCEEYLRNIFLDPDLIPIPNLIRPIVASIVGMRRSPSLRKSYEAMGRYSPILAQTKAQAKALEGALGEGFSCFVGMRYWDPFIEEACCAVRTGGFGRIVLLPLYPQESRTTTGSSINEARRCLEELRYLGEVVEVRSFWDEPGYLEALAAVVASALATVPETARVLFSAHGLPLSIAKRDTYPVQIGATVAEICRRLGFALDPIEIPGRDRGKGSGERGAAIGETSIPHPSSLSLHRGHRAALSWQSKVGPAKWLTPSVEHTLEAWSGEGVKDIALVPVAFVSEHSETLYELDVLYGGMARELGMSVTRVPTVQTHPAFVGALAQRVRGACALK